MTNRTAKKYEVEKHNQNYEDSKKLKKARIRSTKEGRKAKRLIAIALASQGRLLSS